VSQLHVSLDVSAVPAQPAGAGRYIYELARQQTQHDHVMPTFVSRREDGQRWRDLGNGGRVEAIAPSKRPLRLLWEQIRLPKLVDSMGVQLHHGPHYTLPERAHVPLVATIHDMTFFDHPEWHEPAKVPVFRRAIRRAVERATALVAVSDETARRMQAHFDGVDVTVIPLAVDHDRFCRTDNAAADRELLASCGISGSFVAFVGTIEPRKDVPTLLRAFDRIATSRDDLQLVIAGRDGWGVHEVNEAMRTMRCANRVIRPGFLPDEAIPALLRRARAVAYPSLAEGFGLPALEALACGAPLVTTRGSAMEDVVEGAATLIDPGDVSALAAALDALVDDGGESRRLRAAGPTVAAKYTWEACATSHVELYRRIIA
jgi:glycosyltransferase involved in cell wall biosynthesis